MWLVIIQKHWKTILILLLFVITISITLAMFSCSCILGTFEGGLLRGFGSAGDINNGTQDNHQSASGGTVDKDCIEQINKNAKKYINIVNEAAIKYNMDPALISAIIDNESSWNPNAYNPSGASGMMQFLPDTWAEEKIDGNNDGKKDVFDPYDNIYSGTKYLKKRIQWAGGNVWEGVKGYGEGTEEYVNRIKTRYNKYKKCLNSTDSTNTTSGQKIQNLLNYAKNNNWGQGNDSTGCWKATDKLYRNALGNPNIDDDLDIINYEGIPTQQDLTTLRDHLNKDHIVYWYVRGEYSGQHWIIITNIDSNNNITYLDPIGAGSIITKAYDYKPSGKNWYYFSRTPKAPNSYLRGIYRY